MAGRSDVSVEQEQAGNPGRVAASTVPLTTTIKSNVRCQISLENLQSGDHRLNVKTVKYVTLSTSQKSVKVNAIMKLYLLSQFCGSLLYPF